jgi:hypothetical protein
VKIGRSSSDRTIVLELSQDELDVVYLTFAENLDEYASEGSDWDVARAIFGALVAYATPRARDGYFSTERATVAAHPDVFDAVESVADLREARRRSVRLRRAEDAAIEDLEVPE